MTNPALSLPAPGTVLAGKYRVERIVGQGGMGVVLEAHHLALDERVALKLLLPEYAKRPEYAARFAREARAAAKIKSEHVARVSDVGTLEDGAPYMVMELLDGSDLAGLLQKAGVLSIADAVDYVIQSCEAIAEAHAQGIVHRDLKPANLFLHRKRNGTAIVKVLDFGISKMEDGAIENLTRTGAAMGSALYMSPEQMRHTRGVDHRTDIYALGIALYELLGGKQPYYAETLPQLCAEVLTGTPLSLRTLRPEVPEGLAAVLEKAYARERGERHSSIADFVVALAPFAPPRSKPIIEGISRISGLETPASGAESVIASRASGPGGTAILDPVSTSVPIATLVLPDAPEPTAQSLASFVPGDTPSPTRAGGWLAVVLVLGALGLSMIGAVFLLRHMASAPQATPEAAATALPPDSVAPPVVTPVEAIATAIATAAPAPSATVAKKPHAPAFSTTKPVSTNPFGTGDRR